MAGITVWGRLNSANVQKVIWALEELDLAYESVPLGGSFGGLNDAGYRAMNPNGLVPTLRDGDLVLWESHAIVRYLAAAYGAGWLFPASAAERAIVDQWTDWTATSFQPAWIAVFWHVVRTPVAQHDDEAIRKAMVAAAAAFAILDARLAASPFVGGQGLTYADIVTGVAMYRWTTLPVERPAFPNVDRWHKALLERPAFRQAVCVPYDELVGRLSF